MGGNTGARSVFGERRNEFFGGIGVSWANRGVGHRGLAWAGVVLGIIDVLLFIVLIALAGSHHGHFYWHVG